MYARYIDLYKPKGGYNMAKTDKFKELSTNIISLVGGKENVEFFIHCVTRLRFNVKDRSLVKMKEIEKISNVIGVQWSGEQLQVIIGPEVAIAYDMICEQNGLFKEGALEENLDENLTTDKKKFSITKVLETIAACFTPLIPMFVGIGMLQAVLMLLSHFGIVSAESDTYVILSSVSDTALYFLPVAVGVTASRKLGASLSMGILLGALLIHPTLSGIILEGTTMFGIQVPATYYCYTVFPMILTMFVCSYVEKFLNKYMPVVLQQVLVPLFTILIMVPLMLICIAPIGVTLGIWLSNFFVFVYDKFGPIAVALVCATYPIQVMTGMHFGWDAYVMNAYATVGYDGLSAPTDPIHNTCEGAACLAVALKTKNKSLKATTLAAASAAIISGISEPAIYGVTFRYKKPLLAVIAGCFVGGFYAGFNHVVKGTYGGSNILGLGVFLNPDPNSFIHIIIAIILAAIVTFVVTLVITKPEDYIDNKE